MGLFQRIRNATSFPGDSVSNPSGDGAHAGHGGDQLRRVTINEEMR